MKKFTFGALLLLLWTSPSLAVFCDLLPTCTGSSPCDFNDQASWVACGVGGPQAGDQVLIRPGLAAVVTAMTTSTGPMTIEGTLAFDSSASQRDANGFRTLTLVAEASGNVLTIGPTGTWRQGPGDVLAFDSTAGRATTFIQSGGRFIAQGRVTETTVAAIQDVNMNNVCSGDGVPYACCSAGQDTCRGKQWWITPADGGPFVRETHLGRRIVFQSGKARNRHYEISNGSAGAFPNQDSFIVATDLDVFDGSPNRSLGQNLKPHSPIGTFPTPRHLVPHETPNLQCTAADAPFDCCTGARTGNCDQGTIKPKVGDRIAIVEDTWIKSAGGANGYEIRGPQSGSDPFPWIVKAANVWQPGTSIGFCFQAYTSSDGMAAGLTFDFNNVHDQRCGTAFISRGVNDLTFRWNAFHDTAHSIDGQGGGIATVESEVASNHAADSSSDDITVTDNIFYRIRGNVINLNDVGISAGEESIGGLVSRNVVFDGCTTDVGECGGLEVNGGTDFAITNNVIYDMCSTAGNQGSGLQGPGVDNNLDTTGTYYRDNWIVNVCGYGLNFSKSDAVQNISFVRNYVSHVKNDAARGGRHYSGVYKNVGMANASVGAVLRNPLTAYGMYLRGVDPFVRDSPSCSVSCSRNGIDFRDGIETGNENLSPVYIEDIVIVETANTDIVNRAAIFYSGNFDGTIKNVTIDGRGINGEGLNFSYGSPPDPSIIVTIDDLAVTHIGEDWSVQCSPAGTPAIGENIGNILSNASSNPPEHALGVNPNCPNGTNLSIAGLDFENRAGENYNWVQGSPRLTMGSSPAGVPIGARAFRFDPSILNELWDGLLTFEGPMPANIDNAERSCSATGVPLACCTGANTGTCSWDSDDDGVLDLHDNCVKVSNSDQMDTDADGLGDRCDGD